MIASRTAQNSLLCLAIPAPKISEGVRHEIGRFGLSLYSRNLISFRNLAFKKRSPFGKGCQQGAMSRNERRRLIYFFNSAFGTHRSLSNGLPMPLFVMKDLLTSSEIFQSLSEISHNNFWDPLRFSRSLPISSDRRRALKILGDVLTHAVLRDHILGHISLARLTVQI